MKSHGRGGRKDHGRRCIEKETSQPNLVVVRSSKSPVRLGGERAEVKAFEPARANQERRRTWRVASVNGQEPTHYSKSL